MSIKVYYQKIVPALEAAGVEPMSEDEIVNEIAAVRAQRRLQKRR
jgi:hypothetical protein